jgi:hypothetical protein
MADVNEKVDAEVVEDALDQVEKVDVDALMTKALEIVAAQRQGPELAEPEDDEDEEQVIFVRNGWLRVVIAGEQHKLRRPFVGELRDLEASAEADTEVLQVEQRLMSARAEKALTRAREIGEEAQAIDEGDPRRSELDAEAARLAVEVGGLTQKLVHKAMELREAWWIEVFKTLTPPNHPTPEQMPSWVGDADVQQQVIQHWRAVPLVSGR